MIPEDIMKTAEATLDTMLCSDTESCGGADGLRRDSIDVIARALLAERERAAQIADVLRANPRYTEWPYATACADIAAAIRNA